MREPRIVDIYAAALAIDARPATIRIWVHRHELTHHGYDRKRRVLVDLNEVEQRNTNSRLTSA